MPKRSIRTQFLAERKSRTIEACASLSMEIQERFLRSSLFHSAGCVALYSAIHNEVLTSVVAEQTITAGKMLAYPRVNADSLEFVAVTTPAELVPGAFGVLEPPGEGLVSAEALDLIVVPGVVFDQHGHRLGYGRGFYDRALTECRENCVKVGFAFDFQLIDALPAAAHDKTLSALMTETRTLNFST